MSGNLFLAIDLSVDERHAVSAALRDASPGPRIPGRQVTAENWHVTVRFLGEVDEVILDRLRHELDQSLAADPGTVVCTGLGAFPRPSKATVVYAGISDPAGLLDYIAAECEIACRHVGLEPEGRPFVPHITLSRVRPPVDVRRLIQRFGDFAVDIDVRQVDLLQTVQVPGGVRYRTLDSFPLARTPA